jgi:hypothetical protein
VKFKVTGEGSIRAIELELEGMERRATTLRRPAFQRVRARWNEAEERILASRPGWAPRLASTRRRYEWPVRGDRADAQLGRVSGRMHRALTTPDADGILQYAAGGGDALTFTFGPIPNTNVAHANFFSAGRGGQVARPAVDIDDRGLTDALDDIAEHMLLGRHAGRP